LGRNFGVEVLQFSRILLVLFPEGSNGFNVEAQKSRSEDYLDGSVGACATDMIVGRVRV
jgi:hypothetical protein